MRNMGRVISRVVDIYLTLGVVPVDTLTHVPRISPYGKCAMYRNASCRVIKTLLSPCGLDLTTTHQ